LTDTLPRIRAFISGARAEILVFFYLLAVSLIRKSPFWPAGYDLPWQAGLVLALIPLIPALITRKIDHLAKGYIVTLFLPFQSAISMVSVVVIFAVAWRSLRQWIRGDRGALRWNDSLVWIAAYLAFAAFHWIVQPTARHSLMSSGLAFLTIIATPTALVLLARATGEERKSEEIFRFLLTVILLEAFVLVLYPLITRNPVMLAAVINGFLKPIYAALDLPWTYPWVDPDWNPGSLTIPNYAAVISAVGAVYFLVRIPAEKHPRHMAAFLLLSFTAFMAENAMAIGAAAAAVAISAVIAAMLRILPARTTVKKACTYAAGIAFSGLIVFLLLTYLGPGRFAETQKGHYYSRTLSMIAGRPLKALVGYGPGGYGSRVSFLRVKSDPYHIRLQFTRAYPIRIFSDSSARSDFAEDYEKILASPAEWKGESQGQIYSGLLALIMENGIIGLGLLAGLALPIFCSLFAYVRNARRHDMKYGITALFGICFLMSLAVFYNYTEIPTVFGVCAFPALLIHSTIRDRAISAAH
jgi:hypothetical protein